ncbi:hypothetical protein GWG65_21335 [Bradyrhizobium sp. CSA207]|uniref:hypothetical protein n=1 Tax=Bradyrhizobium sp. CSA207 TaxID=2698826 RepID=UPI0023AECD9E|nr:hypothetical protein [Bradyrhizobium sp. CSA207]MDE5443945.1 hypothetical protein [Bradyrhizobium sp. CSA207]
MSFDLHEVQGALRKAWSLSTSRKWTASNPVDCADGELGATNDELAELRAAFQKDRTKSG